MNLKVKKEVKIMTKSEEIKLIDKYLRGIVIKDIEIPEESETISGQIEGFARLSFKFRDDNDEIITAEYTMTMSDDEYTPFGINGMLFDEKGRILDRGCIHNKFSTLSECIIKMQMLAKFNIQPCTLDDAF